MKKFLKIAIFLLIFLIIIAFSSEKNTKNSQNNVNEQINLDQYIGYEKDNIKIEEIKEENRHIIGIIRNNSNETKKLVKIDFDGYDKNGNKLSSYISDNITDLMPNETWKFDILIYDNNIKKLDNMEMTIR